jgi:hypothetical protein
MRRLPSLVSIGAASAACLLALGWSVPARAATGPLDQFVAAWMGVVAVIGADAVAADGTEMIAGDDDRTFAIDDEGDEGDEARRPDRDRRSGEDRHADGRRRHHGDHPHGGPHHGRMHDRGPHHGGMGPGRMGPPGGPDAHHPAMRAFHEIIRRLARIEEKLGIESGPPSGPRGDRRPRPEMQRPRGPQEGEGVRERRDIPEDVRRQMEQRMQEGRRHMEQAKERMEQARQKFQAMQERIEQLEAEVERLKAGK